MCLVFRNLRKNTNIAKVPFKNTKAKSLNNTIESKKEVYWIYPMIPIQA